MKRYSQNQFGDMEESPTGKYVLYTEIGQPEIDSANIDILESFRELVYQCKSLVDGAMEIVELYNPKSPEQHEWKKNWLMMSKILVGDK